MSYTLPDNFENLTVTGSDRYAFGNNTDNIVTGGSDSQTIDGRRGNDVLIGAVVQTPFVFKKGNGNDLIGDYDADDIVRLEGYAFTSFEQILANVAQEGANLRLSLADGESLVFANTTADQLQAGQFRLSLDRSALTQTFSDDFNRLQLHNGTSGVWDPKFWWAPEKGGSLPGKRLAGLLASADRRLLAAGTGRRRNARPGSEYDDRHRAFQRYRFADENRERCEGF
ncbi:hypothetical protein ABIA15_006018 [Sinorhizobium fredii]